MPPSTSPARVGLSIGRPAGGRQPEPRPDKAGQQLGGRDVPPDNVVGDATSADTSSRPVGASTCRPPIADNGQPLPWSACFCTGPSTTTTAAPTCGCVAVAHPGWPCRAWRPPRVRPLWSTGRHRNTSTTGKNKSIAARRCSLKGSSRRRCSVFLGLGQRGAGDDCDPLDDVLPGVGQRQDGCGVHHRGGELGLRRDIHRGLPLPGRPTEVGRRLTHARPLVAAGSRQPGQGGCDFPPAPQLGVDGQRSEELGIDGGIGGLADCPVWPRRRLATALRSPGGPRPPWRRLR
jgi:hypothetical protein